MANDRGSGFVFVPRSSELSLTASYPLLRLLLLVAGFLVLSQPARSQNSEAPSTIDTPAAANTIAETDAPPATNTISATSSSLATGAIMTPKPVPAKKQHASDISISAMFPYGDYRLFAATVRCNAWTVGVEYDRNSWGHFMGSRVDYSVEVIPVLLLNQPAHPNFWGGSSSPQQKIVPGISITPFGFRFLWRSNKAIKPYVIGKLGAAVFTQKALSPQASYVNFNVQAAFGLQIKMTENWDLRIDPFQFFHVSNGYLAASNPGMDELAMKFGVTYHLNKGDQAR